MVPVPICVSILSSLSHGLGEMPSPLVRPLGPPPGIPYPLISTSYGQRIFPTLNYPTWGSTMGYNFDPMMGQPLWPSISSSYHFLSGLPGMFLSMSINLSLADLPALLDTDNEECPPLVVEPPAHSSQVVTGRMVPTITVSLSVAETTLSASPRLSSRVSTSSASVAGRDVWRVIQQHPLTSPNTALVRAGVGWGNVIAKKLAKIGAGKGWSIPSSNTPKETREQEGDRRYMDVGTSADVPLPVTMKLNPQGPPVSYAEAASWPRQTEIVTEDTTHMCNVWMRDALWDKEKAAAQATLDCIEQKEWDEQAVWKKEKECQSKKSHQPEVQWRLAKEGAEWQEKYNQQQRASRACPNPITDPLGCCEYMWAKQDKYKTPKWAGDLWSTSPMDHEQLATSMVCSWGLVMAYWQTHQNVYICLPTLHVLEAYSHKVNHDTHKEITTQECAVVQYAHALQYVSYCNDVRSKNKWAPTVKHIWVEVVKPFGSLALCNLDLSHFLGDVMHPNWGAKIPDYGVMEHIAFVCSAFFKGIESCSQYEQRRKRWEEHQQTKLAAGDHRAPSLSPRKRTQDWDEWESESTEHRSRYCSKSRSRWDIRGQQSQSIRRSGSQPLKNKSSCDSSCLCSWKLPTPPQFSWENVLGEPNTPQTESQQTAFSDTMESNHSSSMSWEDQVQEEEWQKEDSVLGGGSRNESSPEPDTPPPAVEGEVPTMFLWLTRASLNMTWTSW